MSYKNFNGREFKARMAVFDVINGLYFLSNSRTGLMCFALALVMSVLRLIGRGVRK